MYLLTYNFQLYVTLIIGYDKPAEYYFDLLHYHFHSYY